MLGYEYANRSVLGSGATSVLSLSVAQTKFGKAVAWVCLDFFIGGQVVGFT